MFKLLIRYFWSDGWVMFALWSLLDALVLDPIGPGHCWVIDGLINVVDLNLIRAPIMRG